MDGEREVLIEVDDTYYDARDVEKAKEEFVSELESEISDMEREFEGLEAEEFEEGEEDNQAEMLALSTRLDTLRANLAEVEKHSF